MTEFVYAANLGPSDWRTCLDLSLIKADKEVPVLFAYCRSDGWHRSSQCNVGNRLQSGNERPSQLHSERGAAGTAARIWLSHHHCCHPLCDERWIHSGSWTDLQCSR